MKEGLGRERVVLFGGTSRGANPLLRPCVTQQILHCPVEESANTTTSALESLRSTNFATLIDPLRMSSSSLLFFQTNPSV
jgi:hypothetical protein